MTTPHTPACTDRRRSFRLPVEGTVLLWSDMALAGRYALGELSMRGCLLHDGPEQAEGAPLCAVVQIPGQPPFALPGRVVRAAGEGSAEAGLALEFDEASTLGPHADWMAAPAANEQYAEAGCAVLVHPQPRPLDGVLRRLGYGVQSFATALDALRALETSAMSADLILVSADLIDFATDLVRLIGRKYPAARCVLLSAQDDDLGQSGQQGTSYEGAEDHPDALWNLLAPEVATRRVSRALQPARVPEATAG